MKAEKPAQWYDEVYRTSQRYNRPSDEVEEFDLWLAIIRDFDDDTRLLDIGCGTGQFVELCFAFQHKATGIDFSRVAIQKAKAENPNLKFEVVDFHNDKIDFSKYNTCTILEVLEHIENDIELLAKIPQGMMVYLSVPNFDSESHVRYFKDMDEVINRYCDLIDISFEYEMNVSDENKIFCIGGKRI